MMYPLERSSLVVSPKGPRTGEILEGGLINRSTYDLFSCFFFKWCKNAGRRLNLSDNNGLDTESFRTMCQTNKGLEV